MVIELVKVKRANCTESIHYGHALVISSSGLVKAYGDPQFQCFTRSLIKPIQAKIALDILGEQVSTEDLAIGSASHSGNTDSVNLVQALLQKFSNTEDLLKCGTYTESGKTLQSKLVHNCSGKHSLLLAACKKQNWPLHNYDKLEHPVQQLILSELKRLSNQSLIKTGVDGCGLVTFYLSLESIAKIFLNLIDEPAYQKVINAMNQYPMIIGGAKQFDSLLMQHYPNQFLAKGGAEGSIVIANLAAKEVFLLKIIDGSNRAKAFISNSFMVDLSWIKKGSILIDPKIYNSNQEAIGEFTKACL